VDASSHDRLPPESLVCSPFIGTERYANVGIMRTLALDTLDPKERQGASKKASADKAKRKK
jgi:hypothetical protein